MKNLKHLLFGIVALFGFATQAQVAVNVNIGPPPVWGPPVTVEEYYYLPDVESYYDLRTSQFIYLNRGTWIRSKSLPARYRGYDLNRGNVIVINDYHGNKPYTKYKVHKTKYAKKWHPSNNGNHKANGNASHKGKGNGNGKGKGNGKH